MSANDYMFDKVSYQTYTEQYHLKQPISARKKAEFNALLKRAIDNELTVDDARILKMYFFQGCTQTEIAEYFGVNRSTVSRRINKSIDILYEKLKYAAEYRFGILLLQRHNKGYCEWDNTIKTRTHFCSYGEKREGAEDA